MGIEKDLIQPDRGQDAIAIHLIDKAGLAAIPMVRIEPTLKLSEELGSAGGGGIRKARSAVTDALF